MLGFNNTNTAFVIVAIDIMTWNNVPNYELYKFVQMKNLRKLLSKNSTS